MMVMMIVCGVVLQLDMEDGDAIDVFHQQTGGGCFVET